MEDWEHQAISAVMLAKAMPNMVPEYRVPKPRKWWQFWKPVEWETVRGVSVNQIRIAHGLPPGIPRENSQPSIEMSEMARIIEYAIRQGHWGKKTYAQTARMVLEAMREPTAGMESKARLQLEVCAAFPGGCTIIPLHCWEAMIDAALTPTPPSP